MYVLYSSADAAIFTNVLSGMGGFFALIAVFIFFSIFRYAIASKISAKKAARQEKFSWDEFANAAKALKPDALPNAQPEKAVFIPQVEGSGSTEGKGSSVRMVPGAPVQDPKPLDRTRPRPEPVPVQSSGSMEFRSTEGVGSSAYQSPIASSQTDNSQFKRIDRKLPADKLRAAIVMSEILAKPVSLRRNHAHTGR